MNRKTTKSFNKDTTDRTWYLIDLKDQVVGRAASKIAGLLVGKDKPTYTPHADTGHFIVAINASQVRFTGKKLADKIYYSHSGYIGGLKEAPAYRMLEKKPTELFKLAVWGMLPKNRLSRQLIKKLKIYASNEHPHASQKLETINL
jgi:large subunit ribosomal protein L13